MSNFWWYTSPPPKKKIENGSINYSFGDELVFGWNDTIGLLDITHNCLKKKKKTSVQPVGYMLFLARPIILQLKMAVLSEALQTDGFESFWYSLYTWWLHLPQVYLDLYNQQKAPTHSSLSLKLLTKFEISSLCYMYQNKAYTSTIKLKWS